MMPRRGQIPPVEYSKAAPLNHSDCRAWLIEYSAGGKDILLTSVTMKVEDVVRMIAVHTHDDFTVGNITVGMLPIHPDWSKPDGGEIPQHLQDMYTIYFGDGRKVDSDGMVQV